MIRSRWNGELSHLVNNSKGTRQGGLSSPFIFIIFHQEMIETLSTIPAGVKIRFIANQACSVFSSADDVLLLSAHNRDYTD